MAGIVRDQAPGLRGRPMTAPLTAPAGRVAPGIKPPAFRGARWPIRAPTARSTRRTAPATGTGSVRAGEGGHPPGTEAREPARMLLTSFARASIPDGRRHSDPLEALNGEHEDGGATHLDLEGIWEEELARLHDGRHRIDKLRTRVAVLADDLEGRVHLVILHTKDHRGVGLLEEAARAMQPGGPELAIQERIHQVAGVLRVDDRDDELHGAEYRRRSRRWTSSRAFLSQVLRSAARAAGIIPTMRARPPECRSTEVEGP
jgi:hypothetical protein